MWGFFESFALVSDVDWMMVDMHSRRCSTDVGHCKNPLRLSKAAQMRRKFKNGRRARDM